MFILIILLIIPFWIVNHVESGSMLLSVLLMLIYIFIYFQIRKNIFNPEIKTIITLYRSAFGIFVLIGTIAQLSLVWTLADLFNGLMAFPNLIGLLGLSGLVVKITRDYMDKKTS